MDGYKLGVVETHFAELIWQHEPLTSGELVKLCEQDLQWKKSTTYTVLKKREAFLFRYRFSGLTDFSLVSAVQNMLDRYSLLMIDFKYQKSIINRPTKKGCTHGRLQTGRC